MSTDDFFYVAFVRGVAKSKQKEKWTKIFTTHKNISVFFSLSLLFKYIKQPQIVSSYDSLYIIFKMFFFFHYLSLLCPFHFNFSSFYFLFYLLVYFGRFLSLFPFLFTLCAVCPCYHCMLNRDAHTHTQIHVRIACNTTLSPSNITVFLLSENEWSQICLHYKRQLVNKHEK